jgi:hypothetical protein
MNCVTYCDKFIMLDTALPFAKVLAPYSFAQCAEPTLQLAHADDAVLLCAEHGQA